MEQKKKRPFVAFIAATLPLLVVIPLCAPSGVTPPDAFVQAMTYALVAVLAFFSRALLARVLRTPSHPRRDLIAYGLVLAVIVAVSVLRWRDQSYQQHLWDVTFAAWIVGALVAFAREARWRQLQARS